MAKSMMSIRVSIETLSPGKSILSTTQLSTTNMLCLNFNLTFQTQNLWVLAAHLKK